MCRRPFPYRAFGASFIAFRLGGGGAAGDGGLGRKAKGPAFTRVSAARIGHISLFLSKVDISATFPTFSPLQPAEKLPFNCSK
jgi:hypothetical protein